MNIPLTLSKSTLIRKNLRIVPFFTSFRFPFAFFPYQDQIVQIVNYPTPKYGRHAARVDHNQIFIGFLCPSNSSDKLYFTNSIVHSHYYDQC